MREIKFRSWDKFKQRILYRTLYDRNWYATEYNDENGCNCVKGIRPEDRNHMEIMQYTGLKDKNGKEIYEGDIVQMFFNDSKGIVKGIIEWNWKECKFWIRVCWKINEGSGGATMCTLGDYLLKENKFESIEIIGNIYENPELLNASEVKEE